MRSAIIENGVVTNVVLGSIEGSVECADEVSIGWAYSAGAFSAPVEVIDLDELKTTLKAAIDAAAEAERLRYITAGAGQAMTYQRKAEEARACLSATDPVPADYPMLAAEIGITAGDLTGVAQIVNAAYLAWLNIGSRIEAERLGTKATIDAATTVEEASAAAEAVAWPNS